MNVNFQELKTAMSDGKATCPRWSALDFDNYNKHIYNTWLYCTITIVYTHYIKLLYHWTPELVTSDQECSSVSTFRGVVTIVKQCRPRIIVLENVDSIDSATGEVENETKKELEAQSAFCLTLHIYIVLGIDIGLVWNL